MFNFFKLFFEKKLISKNVIKLSNNYNMNIYNKLPIEICDNIDKFIHINNKQYTKENIINNIEKGYIQKIKKRLIEKYTNRENSFYTEQHTTINAFDWLENDFGRWLNDNIPTMHFLTNNYKKFFRKVFNINVETDDDLTFYLKKYCSKTLMNTYFNFLTVSEVEYFEEFVKENIFTTY